MGRTYVVRREFTSEIDEALQHIYLYQFVIRRKIWMGTRLDRVIVDWIDG